MDSSTESDSGDKAIVDSVPSHCSLSKEPEDEDIVASFGDPADPSRAADQSLPIGAAGGSLNGRAFGLTGRFVSSFHPSSFRPFVRRNYRFELLAAATWPVAVAMVEGPVTGVIAKKTFVDTPDWVIATLSAAPAFCNISSFLWARFADGRLAVRALASIQLALLVLLAVITVVPLNTIGLYLFLGAAVSARLCLVGVITLRSVLWRANYARFERAHVTGKIITIHTLIVASASLLLGRVMDVNQASFRFVYPLAILAGLIGVRAYSKIRIRRPHLITPDRGRESFTTTDYGQPIFLAHPRRLRRYGHYLRSVVHTSARAATHVGGTLRSMAHVLHDDLPYRGYMVCMTLTGIGNLAISAPMILLLTEKFELNYTLALLFLQSIPLVMMPISIPLWAWMLDGMHVIRFRSIHVWVFVAAHVFIFCGACWYSLPLILCGQIVLGLGFGGGALAWNIGHNDFSSRRDAGLYMTVHVTLTGLRGLVGAYLGVVMYSGIRWDWLRLPALEEYSFAFWAAFTAIGAIGFSYLNWRFSEITHRSPRET